MSASGPIVPVEGEAASPRQRAHVAREKWEESWLAQQRDVIGVVVNERRESEAPVSHDNREALREAFESRSAPEAHTATSLSEAETLERTQSEPPRISIAQRAASKASTTTIGGIAEVRTPAHTPVENPVHTHATRTPEAVRDPLPRSAFWRDKESIDVAMRLADADHRAEGVVAQLRQWLRGASASLRKVFVNGRPWHESSTSSSSNRARQPNQHTYI